MTTTKFNLLATITILCCFTANAQKSDTLNTGFRETDTAAYKINWKKLNEDRLQVRQFYLPVTMIVYGAVTLGTHGAESINGEIKEELYSERQHKKNHIDNYLQFAPAAAVYGLNALGIKGRHNFRDRSMIFLMSNVILNTTVFSVKQLTHQLRPDGSAYSSFPSGHTAEAFANAEFLRLEYKDVSPWYGVAGYAVAATTGYLRLYNNKHWLSDVVAGAGVGIVSTRLAWWLYPKIQGKLFKNSVKNTIVFPGYQQGTFTLGLVKKL